MDENDNVQAEQNPAPDDDEQYIEETISYTRQRRVYTFICALEDCPYCKNVPMKARNPTRKWCSEEARAEFGRRKRAAQAIEAGRVPGKVGNPLIESDKLSQMGVFFIHALDKLPDVYKVGHTESWDAYETDYPTEAAPQGFDATILVRTPLADLLARKIIRKFDDANVTDNLFKLEAADMRVIQQMVTEHVDAYRND